MNRSMRATVKLEEIQVCHLDIFLQIGQWRPPQAVQHSVLAGQSFKTIVRP